MLRCRVEVTLPDEALARVVAGSLGPEVEEPVPRTRARLHRRGTVIELDVEAEETSSLRAAVNAHLRWMQTGLDVVDAAGAPDPEDGS